MVKKEQFEKFLQRSYLNKTVEQFVTEVNGNEISTYFKTTTGLIGSVKLNSFELEDSVIGFYNPDIALRLLNILDSDIDVTVKKDKEGVVKSFQALDKKGKQVKYAVQDIELFGEQQEKKKPKVSTYEVKINLNAELVDNILKANSCIESPCINFIYEKEKLFVVFGYSDNNTNQIKFELECESLDDIENLPFSSVILSQILSVNSKNFSEGTLEINLRGLMRIFFKDKTGEAEYFLTKLNQQTEKV